MQKLRRDTLYYLFKNGLKDPKKLANLTGYSMDNVYKNIKKFNQGEDPQRKKGSGGQYKISSNDPRRLTQLALNHPKWSSARLKGEMAKRGSPAVSRRTIGGNLIASGLRKLPPKITTNLSPLHMQNRVIWCRKNLNRDWSKVVFTDENYFQLFRNLVLEWARSRPLKQTPKHEPAIMV